MLKYFPNCKLYYGFDTNSSYIKAARKKYKDSKNFFFAKEFDPSLLPSKYIFDLTLIFGLLHHLSNDEVYNLLKKVNKTKKGFDFSTKGSEINPHVVLLGFLEKGEKLLTRHKKICC
jgi:hypothetical protein